MCGDSRPFSSIPGLIGGLIRLHLPGHDGHSNSEPLYAYFEGRLGQVALSIVARRARDRRLVWSGSPPAGGPYRSRTSRLSSPPTADENSGPCRTVRKRHRVGVANQGAGQLRLMDTRQASAPLGSMLMSILQASIESTCHPSRKLALISSWVTRLGPQSPGWRSLKHSM